MACASGDLVAVDPAGAVVGRVRIAPDLRDVVVEGGRLWLSTFRSADVLRVDPDGAILERLRPPDTLFDGAPRPSRASVAWALVPAPDGGVALLHQWRQLSRIDIAEEQDTGDSDAAYGGGCRSVVLGGVTTFEPDGAQRSLAAMPVALAVDLAWGGSWNELQGVGWFVALGANTLFADRYDGGHLRFLPSDFPAAPACADGEPMYGEGGSTAPSWTVAVLPFDDGTLWTLARGPALWDGTYQGASLDEESSTSTASSPADLELLAGFHLFHRNAGGGLTCASCHPEGGDDGQVWSFDVGERRTQPLRASIGTTAPYHWDGEFGTLDALLDEVLFGRMGADVDGPDGLGQDGLDRNLLAWLDALPVPRAAEPPDAVLAARGAEVFAAAGCAGFHAGPALTDNASHDVGTGGVFQTPSLLGVSARPPYLHDGCAEDLRTRFGPCGGDRHGAVVSDADLDALVAYLETL